MKTSKIIFSLILCLTIFIGCKNDDDQTTQYDSVGLILGIDDALCLCCGNWVIDIDGEQILYQFVELPDNTGIDLNNATFPLSVSLNWSQSTSGCEHIVITEIITN